MATNLNSAILDSAILHKTLTQTSSIWLKLIHSGLNLMMAAILSSAIMDSPILHKDGLHSFILTQLMMAAILDSAILDFPLKLTHTYQDWFPPFAQKKLHSFILTHIGDGSHLEFDHHWFIHFSMSSQTHSHLPRLVPSICFCTKKLHSFILTHIGDGRHLEFCHVGFRHCHLGFRHLVFFSQIHSKTLSLHSDSDSN